MNSLYKVAKFVHVRYLNAKDNRIEDLKPLGQMSSLLAANFATVKNLRAPIIKSMNLVRDYHKLFE